MNGITWIHIAGGAAPYTWRPARGSPILLVLAFAPFALMLFWLVRVRFSRASPQDRPAAAAPLPATEE